jgi:hypothetical protein
MESLGYIIHAIALFMLMDTQALSRPACQHPLPTQPHSNT